MRQNSPKSGTPSRTHKRITRMRTQHTITTTLAAVAVMTLLAAGSSAHAALLYSDGFNAAAGDQNNTQGVTTLAVQVNANYDNWSIVGVAGHQVDLNTANAGMVTGNPESLPNPNDWAAMLLFNQQLTSTANIGANVAGQSYTVDFSAGPADYSGGQQSLTSQSNGVRIEVIDNNGAGSVIGTFDFTAIDFDTLAGPLDLGLSSGSFSYAGSGTGDVKLRVTGLGGGVFNGSIDSISISDAIVAPPAAGLLYSEDFNSYAGNQNNTQFETGLDVAHTGSVTGWSNSGAGTMHAVDLDNTAGEDWAIMFFQDNVISSNPILDSNFLGTEYELTFDYGTAVYGAAQESQRTLAGDALLVEIVRASDNSVLASDVFTPGAWGDGNRNLEAALMGTLAYTGDGTGNIFIRIGPSGPLTSGRFEGEIDNLALTVLGSSAIPTPAALPAGLALIGMIAMRRRRA